jgi:hypothetical protein
MDASSWIALAALIVAILVAIRGERAACESSATTARRKTAVAMKNWLSSDLRLKAKPRIA